MGAISTRLIYIAIFLVIACVFVSTHRMRDKEKDKDRVREKHHVLIQRIRTTSQFLRNNCSCLSEWNCGCCANIINTIFNFNQSICARWTTNQDLFDIRTDIILNGDTVLTNHFSGNEIPPFCIPLPVPLPLPLSGCLKLHGIRQHSDTSTLHACSNATLNFLSFELLNFQLACMDFSVRGIEVVDDSNDNGVTTTANPEISLGVVDEINSTNN
ncbi:uncharacterized protein LOC119673916 [Teleopsis dalmanni]|uniref:uncharacterized protein LOC119673916 n=1 Tax=Teleopsis dalmanni TaxID=139649 RepID=UPI0018CE4126|nr:uncharacterized protein LOC119673916 [Teleopsis dalmanni]